MRAVIDRAFKKEIKINASVMFPKRKPFISGAGRDVASAF